MSDSTKRSRQSRGGRGGREPRAQIVARAAEVWELSLRGYSQREIAERVGISQPAVCKILQRVADQVWADRRAHAQRERARRLAQLDYLYRESLTGYARSQEDDVQQTQRTIHAAAATAVPQDVTEVRVRKRPGDARFLREARETVEAGLRHAPPAMPALSIAAPDLSLLTDAEAADLERLLARATRVEADEREAA